MMREILLTLSEVPMWRIINTNWRFRAGKEIYCKLSRDCVYTAARRGNLNGGGKGGEIDLLMSASAIYRSNLTLVEKIILAKSANWFEYFNIYYLINYCFSRGFINYCILINLYHLSIIKLQRRASNIYVSMEPGVLAYSPWKLGFLSDT